MTPLQPPIGIMGGTFDPIHFGHLRTALELYEAMELSEVRLIPCYQPVHRKPPVASPEARLNMVQAAVIYEPALQADSCEINRRGPSYTIDTLESFRKKLPNTPLCLILGIDALLGFSSWHRANEILQLAHLIIAHRPQYQVPEEGPIAEILKERLTDKKDSLHHQLAGKIILHPVTALEISSTEIRQQIASHKSPRYLLPQAVHEYINRTEIYL